MTAGNKRDLLMARKQSLEDAPEAPAQEEGKGSCLVLMPFGGWFDQYYETIFKPAVEASGLLPVRADDIYRPGTIVNDIWAFTKASKLLLADLTGRNPNVFYELGLAHALAKPVILISESIDQVPFDLRALRVLDYDKNDPGWGDRLRAKITRAIKEVLDSPLEAVLPAFLRVEQDSRQEPVTEQEKAILELRKEVELLRQSMLSNGPWTGLRSRNADEVRKFIKFMLDAGLPPEGVRELLIASGVTGWWSDKDSPSGRQVSLFDDFADHKGSSYPAQGS